MDLKSGEILFYSMTYKKSLSDIEGYRQTVNELLVMEFRISRYFYNINIVI